MINEIQLVHYLSEPVYTGLLIKLKSAASEHHAHSHNFYYTESAVKELQFYELDLKQPVHIFIMQSVIDFQRLGCGYDDFSRTLYEKYSEFFGSEIMCDFPDYNSICCDYIEYSNVIEVKNSDEIIKRLLSGRCVPEQLDRTRWIEFKKPQSVIKFCMAKTDGTHIETLACAHGMALKSRIKEKEYHKYNGILPFKLINYAAERDILAWLLHMYAVDEKSEDVKYTPKDMISVLSGENFTIAGEFISLAECLCLKPAVRYAAGHKTWKCVYTVTKPKRTVFTIECAAGKLNIKACLFNIGSYLSGFPDISENIKLQLSSSWNCSLCNTHCRGGVPLTLNGITENKCIGGAFSFSKLNTGEWRMIINLIKKEMNISKEKEA